MPERGPSVADPDTAVATDWRADLGAAAKDRRRALEAAEPHLKAAAPHLQEASMALDRIAAALAGARRAGERANVQAAAAAAGVSRQTLHARIRELERHG